MTTRTSNYSTSAIVLIPLRPMFLNIFFFKLSLLIQQIKSYHACERAVLLHVLRFSQSHLRCSYSVDIKKLFSRMGLVTRTFSCGTQKSRPEKPGPLAH